MPNYDFRCSNCDEHFSVQFKINERNSILCPNCTSNKVEQIYSSPRSISTSSKKNHIVAQADFPDHLGSSSTRQTCNAIRMNGPGEIHLENDTYDGFDNVIYKNQGGELTEVNVRNTDVNDCENFLNIDMNDENHRQPNSNYSAVEINQGGHRKPNSNFSADVVGCEFRGRRKIPNDQI